MRADMPGPGLDESLAWLPSVKQAVSHRILTCMQAGDDMQKESPAPASANDVPSRQLNTTGIPAG